MTTRCRKRRKISTGSRASQSTLTFLNYIGNTTHHLKKSLQKMKKNTHVTSAFSQRLRKYTFTAVHTKTHKRRFQIYPLWRAFSNLCVYGERFHRLRVDGRPKRIKKFAFTSVCVYNRLRVDGAQVGLFPAGLLESAYLQLRLFFS